MTLPPGPVLPAQTPPAGLPGLDPSWSRHVEVPRRTAGTEVDPPGPGASSGAATDTWHVLDNAADLAGPPRGTLLCVHGNPTWSYLWRDLLRAGAAAGWRVVAVDQLGMGFSERTGRVHRLADRIADLGALTAALGLDGPVVTVGHDWGGPVSLGWAVAHPERLAAVVLTNTAVHQDLDARTPALLRLAMAPGVLPASTVVTPGFLETTLAIAHPPLAPDVRAAFRAPYASPDRRAAIGHFVADIPADAAHPSRPALEALADGVAGLHVPALLLWGPRDPVFGEQFLADLLRRLPQADVHRFEGAGHLLPEDADVAGAVVTWLAERFPEVESGGPSDHRVRAAVDGGTSGAGADPGAAPATTSYRPLWRALEDRASDDGVALVELAPAGGGGPRAIRWSLLARRVDELTRGLRGAGVRPGDRVCLLVPPGADLTAVLYACLRLGAVVVVADAGLGVRGLSRAVRGARPDLVVGIPRALAAARGLGWPARRVLAGSLPLPARAALGVETTLDELAHAGRAERAAGTAPPPEPGPDDDAAILFTSGSTGPAKGVAYTHARLAAMARAVGDTYGIGPGTPLVAAFAPFALLGPALGATCASPDMDVTSPRTLTARALADAVAAIDAAVVFASPAALAGVVADAGSLDDAGRRALAGVRTFLSAGAPVPPELLAAAGRLMPNAEPHTPYGMTEVLPVTDISLAGILAAGAGTGTAAGGPAGADARVGGAQGVCVGRPVAGAEVAISALDDAGRATGPVDRAPGVTGEILVSAPHVMARYDRLWLTHARSRRDAGWHRTGDVGHLDAEGRLWVEGRLAHVLTTPRGVLTPVGLERRAEAVDGVGRAAAVGVGPAGVQQVVLVVETRPAARRPGLADLDLTRRLRAALDVLHVPVAAVLVVPELPTDVRHNSKIERTRLARWAGGVLAGGPVRRP